MRPLNEAPQQSRLTQGQKAAHPLYTYMRATCKYNLDFILSLSLATTPNYEYICILSHSEMTSRVFVGGLKFES